MAETAATEGPVVVGVDGSAASLDALRWAARQARLTGAPLLVLTVWSFPEHPTPFGIVPPIPLPSDELDEVRRRLDDAVEEVMGGTAGVDVTTEVVAGDPAATLLDAAGRASLLVVGSRGHGAFAGAVLGSVSGSCVRHAACPVVVVRHVAEPR